MFSRHTVPEIAFSVLFASELTFYLLILQTGIVEYHHSDLHEIWMVPAGGVLGIVASIFAYRHRGWLVPLLLFGQTLLSFGYTDDSGVEMFAFGLISGLTAPLLIARIDRFITVMVALGGSYLVGTYYFDLPPDSRTAIAVTLSAVAFWASLFSRMGMPRHQRTTGSLPTTAVIFFWLILDAALFETLLRDPGMHIWGEAPYTPVIVAFHLIGVAVAFKLREWRHSDLFILFFFLLAYATYTLKFQLLLSAVYPFVISFYNVIILDRFRNLHYPNLAVAALSLWIASGFGLMIALDRFIGVAWAVLALLALIHLTQRRLYA